MKYSSTVQALTEVGLDRARDDLALRVGHQATHRGDLPDLVHVSGGARVDHHEDRVRPVEVRLHRVADLAGRVGPDLDQLLAALVVGDQATLELLLDVRGLLSNPARISPLLAGVTTSSMETVTPELVAQWNPASLRASSEAATSTLV